MDSLNSGCEQCKRLALHQDLKSWYALDSNKGLETCCGSPQHPADRSKCLSDHKQVFVWKKTTALGSTGGKHNINNNFKTKSPLCTHTDTNKSKKTCFAQKGIKLEPLALNNSPKWNTCIKHQRMTDGSKLWSPRRGPRISRAITTAKEP